MDPQQNSEETLKRICSLLRNHVDDFMKCSDELIQIRHRKVRESRVIKATSEPITELHKQQICREIGTSITPPQSPVACTCSCHMPALPQEPTSSKEVSLSLDETKTGSISTVQSEPAWPSNAYPDAVEEKEEELQDTDSKRKDDILFRQNLSIMRENVDLKIQMQEMQKSLKQFSRKIDEYPSNHLAAMNDILSKIVCTQKRSEILCDKLCEGIDKLGSSCTRLPKELNEVCIEISKTVGQEYRQIGQELHLTPDEIKKIATEYEDENDCLYQIILEWSKKSDNPSYRALVTACHNVNPDILNSKPLSLRKVRTLQSCYNYMCDNLLEAPILPHLISSGVMSFKLERYILQAQTVDRRVYRLIDILCTREGGFDELLKALDATWQTHVSDILRRTFENITEMGDEVENDKNGKGLSTLSLSQRSSSSDDLDNSRRIRPYSHNLGSDEIIRTIYEIIRPSFESEQHEIMNIRM